MLETNTWKVAHKFEDRRHCDYQRMTELSDRAVELQPSIYGELIGMERKELSLLCRAREGRDAPASTLQEKPEWRGNTHKSRIQKNNHTLTQINTHAVYIN